VPAKSHENLIDAGLTTEDGFLDVDHQTLKHNKYSNIFGIGDVNSLPTTKTFYGGFAQISVVRNNLERTLKGINQTDVGLPLNGIYDGFSEAPLILAQDQLTWIQHYYNQK
jgi:sulfide:quinone oxidoreductase